MNLRMPEEEEVRAACAGLEDGQHQPIIIRDLTEVARQSRKAEGIDCTGWGIVALLCIGAVFYFIDPVLYYLEGEPSIIDSVADIASLRHHEYVMVDLPLEREPEYFGQKYVDPDYAMLEVSGTQGLLRLIAKCEGENPFALLEVPVTGRTIRANDNGVWKINWQELRFALDPQTVFVEVGGPSQTRAILGVLVVLLAVGVATVSILKIVRYSRAGAAA